MKYAAELAPIPRLICDEKPPLNTKIWLITEWGTGFAGNWYKECNAVAWSPLPKLTDEQKRRLKEMKKMASGRIGLQPATEPTGNSDQ